MRLLHPFFTTATLGILTLDSMYLCSFFMFYLLLFLFFIVINFSFVYSSVQDMTRHLFQHLCTASGAARPSADGHAARRSS